MDRAAREDFLHNMAYAYCRWKWLAIIAFVALSAMVIFAGYLITPTWEVKVTLLAEPTLPPPKADFPDPTRPKSQSEAKVYAYHLIRVLQGKEVACSVVREFDLGERLRKKREEPENLRDTVVAWAFNTLSGTFASIGSLFGKVGQERPKDWVDNAAESFRDGLFATMSAEMVEETDIVVLTVNGETPELANAIATFMIDTVRQHLAGVTADGAKAAVAALRIQLENVTREEETAGRAWYAFLESNKGANPDDLASLKTTALSKLYSDRSRLLAEKAELEKQRDEVATGAIAAQPTTMVSDRILGDSVIRQLRETLHSARASLAARLQEVTEEHPDVVAARAQIRQTEAELKTEVDGLLRGVDAELRTTDKEVATAEAELTQIPTRQFEYSRLKMNVDAYRALRRELQDHVESVAVTAESGIPSLTVKVLDRAYVSPVASQSSIMWVIVAIVAIVFSTGVAIVLPPFIEFWRDPIRGPNDLLARGIIPLAVIPKLPLRDRPVLDRREGSAE